MINARGYAAKHSFGNLKPFGFERQEAAANEIEIDVLCCGVCHSDVLGVTGVLESDTKTMKALASSFDFMLSTIPEKHDVDPFAQMLKHDATLAVVGALEPLAPVNDQEVAFHHRRVAGSLIGSSGETQDVLDSCAAKGIGPDIELIPIQQINDACKKIEKGDVRFLYVIDRASSKEEMAAA